MTDRVVRNLFISLAIFGLATNLVGLAYLVVNIVRFLMS